jgi:hypothetical protein
MRETLAVLAAVALAGGCGGRQMLDLAPADGGAAGTSGGGATTGGNGAATGSAAAGGNAGVGGAGGAPAVGIIDLTQAPPTFSMSCDETVGTIAIVNPCLIGGKLGGNADPSSPAPHEVECKIGSSGDVVWSFLVVFPPLQNPQMVALTPTAVDGQVGNDKARVTSVTGSLTFDRVDPTNRAFVAQFSGTVTWLEQSGRTFSCVVFDSIWGAPGPFN